MENSNDDDKRKLSLKVAFLLAIVVPVVIEVVFSLLGAATQPLFGQIELILVLLSFCLTGILTRSAAKGLLAVPAGWINYLIMLVLPFWNPYGSFMEAATPLGMLAPEMLGTITIIMIVVDIVILTLVTFFTGLFSGGVSGAGIVGKIICVFFLVLFLTIPFAYIGVAKIVEGGGYIGAAVLESVDVVEGGLNVTEILGDESKLNELNQKLLSAGENMTDAANALGFVQQNILFSVILQTAGYGDILQLLDVVPAIATFMETTPALLTGLFSLDKGMSQTFDFLSASTGASSSHMAPRYKLTAEYSDTFAEGLSYLQAAVGNFSSAETGLVNALEKIKNALSIPSLAEYGIENVTAIFSDIGDSIPSIISVGDAAIPFINATYETFLGMEAIGENDFSDAQEWMTYAASHFGVADGLLSALNTTDLWEPIADAVEVFTDMTDVLTDIVSVGSNATTVFVAFETAFAVMETLNRTQPYTGTSTPNDIKWDNAEGNISIGSSALSDATSFINTATTKLATYSAKDYGTMAPIGDMFNQFNDIVTQFSGNITDFEQAGIAIDGTFKSLKAFSAGIYGLSQGDFSVAVNNSFIYARENASIAYTALNSAGNLNPSTIQTWQTFLMNGEVLEDIGGTTADVQQDLYHLSEYCITLVAAANSDPLIMAAVIAILDAIDFGAVFGG